MVKRKSKSKPRPPRIFVGKNSKLYIQVGKRKLLIKDAKSYNKADILNTLLSQLLIRRKRRARGKTTRRERKLNKKDLEIFKKFEDMNRNQSKSSLKIPSFPEKGGLNMSDSLFFNAILRFMKLLPKKDINIEVAEQKKRKAKTLKEKKP